MFLEIYTTRSVIQRGQPLEHQETSILPL